ncbi:MAG: hypothetical protein A2161_05330 [Candidatus Schekmanbacteria bacterium RBG_13_48_7]|uniref:MutL C-terminal dimerisation domain-containing protein n=1 Tax=Candidatus Schekmanbacteria bacterium RBG_13_48_7 TaxID=1817878 RepID=A0A1F7RTF7_9BACT|nr:MAG: hypothetical protein A2161_05330 [Candidatus Schekmanbacteria bacterium RBG_13_48_7]
MKSQGLLFPLNIALAPNDIRIAQKFQKMLFAAGFDLEEFGTDSLIVRAVPESIGIRDPQDIILDILAELKSIGEPESLNEIRREIARILACRSAIKSGDSLEALEMEHLVKSIQQENIHYTCPHGRPIIVKYSIESIQKNFGR